MGAEIEMCGVEEMGGINRGTCGARFAGNRKESDLGQTLALGLWKNA